MKSSDCSPGHAISRRISRIRAGDDPTLLATLPSGFAIFGKFQPEALRGACMLLAEPVVSSPNDLTPEERARFWSDLTLLGDAILAATGAERVNYLVLCNQVPELHGHAIPRYAEEGTEKRLLGPFEAYAFNDGPEADVAGRDAELFQALKAALQASL